MFSQFTQNLSLYANPPHWLQGSSCPVTPRFTPNRFTNVVVASGSISFFLKNAKLKKLKKYFVLEKKII
jgi:hypothetical protein